MRRRPWLALVVLILLGISATMFVRSARTARFDDDHAIAIDDSVGPCEAPVHGAVAALPRHHTLVDEVPLAIAVTRDASVIAIAPKTSPPA